MWGTEYEVPAHRMILTICNYEICDTSIKVKNHHH
jgi:hypothetical protein